MNDFIRTHERVTMGMSDEEEAVYEELNKLKSQLKADEECNCLLYTSDAADE